MGCIDLQRGAAKRSGSSHALTLLDMGALDEGTWTTHTTMERDKPDGLGDDQAASWGDYPIDALLIRNETRTVHDVLRRIDNGAFVMDPDFQRDFIWDEEKQSKLIESVVMRIPPARLLSCGG